MDCPESWKWRCSVVSDSLWPHGLYSPWNSPGHSTGVSSLSLLQQIFLTQELNWGRLHCRRILGHGWSPYCPEADDTWVTVDILGWTPVYLLSSGSLHPSITTSWWPSHCGDLGHVSNFSELWIPPLQNENGTGVQELSSPVWCAQHKPSPVTLYHH